MMNKEKYHIGRFAILLLLLIACTSFLYAQSAQPDQQVQNAGNAPKGQKLAFETDGVETATATTTDNGGAMGGIITVEQKLGADRLLFGFPKMNCCIVKLSL